MPTLQFGHPERLSGGIGASDLNLGYANVNREPTPARKIGEPPGLHHLREPPAVGTTGGDTINRRMVRAVALKNVMCVRTRKGGHPELHFPGASVNDVSAPVDPI